MTATICENCGRKIGAIERPAEFDNHIVCPTCFESLKSQRMKRYSAAPQKRSGRGAEVFGAITAIAGGSFATVGYRMFDSLAEQVGNSQAVPRGLFVVGVVVCLVGLLVFAIGRFNHT